MHCRICDAEGAHPSFQAREMMFGMRHRFEYFQCSRCQCLQIHPLPADLSPYYPDGYYSISEEGTAFGGIPQWCYTMMGSALGPEDLMRSHPSTEARDRALASQALAYYFPERLGPTASILDVGCGGGSFLRAIRTLGFERLLGVDAFVPRELHYKDGIRVLKTTLPEFHSDSRWDVIMFHHSFEHMANPHEVLRAVARLLAEEGVCLIRIPVVSLAWERYGINWVQLDAPRHLYLHSTESLRLVAEACGLEVSRVHYDSAGFQFWGSEQYVQDIPLLSERSLVQCGPQNSIFSPDQLAGFDAQAAALNSQERGDQAAFLLRHRRATA